MRQTTFRHLQCLGRGGVLTLMLLAMVASAGCTRRFYRDRADREVADVLAEKDVIPDWKIENYHVYPDARARFADVGNPDRPAMPPDDPAAKMLSPNPQRPGHAGIGRYEGGGYLELLAAWDAYNRGKEAPVQVVREVAHEQEEATQPPNELEPLAAPQKLGSGAQPPLLITLEQAVELGLINSREYQTKRENLYLAALPVTSERFGFAFQAFAVESAIREYTGADTGFGKGDHWRLNSTAGVTKLFSSGALLLFAYANRTVVDLSGRMDLSSVSTLNLDIVQPLLRGGGRAVTLEPLTGVERNLLYEIRDYARFRKEYYHYISAGADMVNFGGGVSAFGVAFAPGSVTLGSGNPARPEILPGGSGRVNLSITSAAPSEGFLPTVQNKGFVSIERKNVERLEGIVKLFSAYEEGGEVSSLQVGQAQLQLLGAQSQYLQSEKDHRDSLDRFKLQLGVPPQLPLELDDSHVRPIIDQYARYETILIQFEDAVKQLEKHDAINEADQMRTRIRKLYIDSPLVQETKAFKATIGDRWRLWEQDQIDDKNLKAKLNELNLAKQKLLDLKTDREQAEKTLTPAEVAELKKTSSEISVGEMELALRNYERMPWKKEVKERDQRERHAQTFRFVRSTVIEVLGEANIERLELTRPLWPTLSPIELAGLDFVRGDLDDAYDVGMRTALDGRLDLMNARAELVDAWRQVAVFANSLLGGFNVGYHMDSNTPPDQAKPFAFQPTRTRHQLFLNTELPLVRLSERNNYRAALIAYQRARRSLMAAEDQVAAQIRNEIRQVQLLARTFQIQQQSVELAFQQVESSLETFRAPQAPGGGGNNAGSVAALTQQLLSAYSNLPRVQRQLLGNWIQFQIARQQLYLDLELMPLDTRGVWIDELSLPSRPGPEPIATKPG